MYAVRRWSVRHAAAWSASNGFERVLVALHPLWNAIGYERLEQNRSPRWSAWSRASCSTARCAASARSAPPACRAR